MIEEGEEEIGGKYRSPNIASGRRLSKKVVSRLYPTAGSIAADTVTAPHGVA